MSNLSGDIVAVVEVGGSKISLTKEGLAEWAKGAISVRPGRNETPAGRQAKSSGRSLGHDRAQVLQEEHRLKKEDAWGLLTAIRRKDRNALYMVDPDTPEGKETLLKTVSPYLDSQSADKLSDTGRKLLQEYRKFKSKKTS